MSEHLDPIQDLRLLGQSVWYDNMYRSLMDTGELQRLIDVGVTGLTSNPTIFEKSISSSDDYDSSLLAYAREGLPPADLFEALAIEDIQAAADLLRPVYDSADGADGFASLEVNPHLARDTEGTIEAARRLFAALDRPNVMIKVPATPEGIPAIRSLIADGININVTLIFSLDMYALVREAYITGLQDLITSGGDPSRVSSVASFFVSRVDTAVDGLIEQAGDDSMRDLMGRAAVSNAKIAYQDFKETFAADRFARMSEMGARVQRPLWASTSAKNPAYSDVLYVETLIGPHTVNTMPDATLAAFLEHGSARETIEQDVDEARETMAALEAGGISMDAVTTRLMHDGVKAFADSFDQLLDNISDKRDRLLSKSAAPAGASLGKARAAADEAVASLSERDAVARIWARDHTLWSEDPTEIADRLGWLDVASTMLAEVDGLAEFARDARDDGVAHVVLLGMGGSSLAPETLRQCFGPQDGWPELITLDSTIPAQVRFVADSIDPARTLFVVSSKSGATIEPNALYRFFRRLVADAVGHENAGRRFVAVTDPDTALDDTARAEGFRRVFRNPPDIGGRYSALSFFGLVPAALAGYDTRALLEGGVAMQAACAPQIETSANPGAWLGAAVGALAQSGRDKLTILTSPTLSAFGLWAEQLVAESLGKDGVGIVPVVGEPPASVESYGDDRQFVYLKLSGDYSDVDGLCGRLVAAGHPLIRYEIDSLTGPDGLGAEFYRWEFAIAVAGAIMGVNPFDQPNVQQAKDLARQAVDRFESDGSVPAITPHGSLPHLVESAEPGDYLAILAYIPQTDETDEALTELRAALLSDHRIVSTLGYGPRYLHSTGQLHKGGANNVIALALTAPHDADADIPGERFDFGTLADAQAYSDVEALRLAGRRTASVILEGSAADSIRALSESMRSRRVGSHMSVCYH